MKVTKQGLARLESSPVKVTLFNGCFNVASVEAEFSRYRLELRVEATNPLLEWQSGNRNSVQLTYWEGFNGYPLAVPPELSSLVVRLREAASMSNEEAAKLSLENKAAFSASWAELDL